jgi:hypothetical protein
MKFNHVPAYGFGRQKKLEIEKTDPLYNPGPGTYAPKKATHHFPTWKIGSEPRLVKKNNLNPGPGQYSKPNDFQNGPKYSMASKAGAYDPVKGAFTPGPGAYTPLTNNRPSSCKYTMRQKPYPKERELTPGPGNYNLRVPAHLVVPSYRFGHEKKGNMDFVHLRFVPGPGNYEFKADALHLRHPKFSFGKEIRGVYPSQKTPGPGQYEFARFIGKEGPKITISEKYKNFDKLGNNYVPGPGQYNEINPNKYRPKTPAYKIGTGKRRGLYDDLEYPGPGQYGPDKSTNLVRPKTPSWKIGTSLRPDLNGAERGVPGVGNYDITKGLGNGPKYSMVGKGNTGNAQNGVPGPGQYNETNAVFVKNPSWKIGTGQRGDDLRKAVRDGYPGPGMYEFFDKTKIKAPEYRFGKQKRGYIKNNDFPGPGQYHIPCAIVDVNNYTREQGNFNKKFKFI